MQKDKNYWLVLDAVIRLEVSKGHLQWKLTEISRLSGVGRPLIYYYFGKSKEEIVQAALKVIGDEFFGLSDERLLLWKERRIVESVQRTRDLLKSAPYVSAFFFYWRHREGEIGDFLKSLEQRYREKLRLAFPEKSAVEIESIFVILFGLIVMPDLNPVTIEAMLRGL